MKYDSHSKIIIAADYKKPLGYFIAIACEEVGHSAGKQKSLHKRSSFLFY